MNRVDILWGLYQEHTTQGRHHETQRQAMTGILLVTATAALGLVGLNKSIDRGDWPLGVLLIAIGVWGALFSLKHYERFRYHMEQAKQLRNAIDSSDPGLDLATKRRQARKDHEVHWERRPKKWIREIHLHTFWMTVPLMVVILGVIVLTLALL